jgi:transcription antitermination factor NusG
LRLVNGWKRLLSPVPEIFLRSLRTGRFQDAVEYLHPSEDGEALQTCSMRELDNECGVAARGSESSWFAAYTTCRHEKRVAQHLTQRGIDHYLPLYSAERNWRDGSRVKLDLPLFPCYIFVRIMRSERVSVLSVPGTLALVGGTGGEPAPLPNTAIEALRTGIRKHRIEPHPLLRVGEVARIRSGAFAGMEGVILRRKSGCRIVLTLEQIMQSVAVEVDEDDLECVGESKHLGRTSVRAEAAFSGKMHSRLLAV